MTQLPLDRDRSHAPTRSGSDLFLAAHPPLPPPLASPRLLLAVLRGSSSAVKARVISSLPPLATTPSARMDALRALPIDERLDSYGRIRRTHAAGSGALASFGSRGGPPARAADSLRPDQRAAAAAQTIQQIYQEQRSAEGLIQRHMTNAHAHAQGANGSAAAAAAPPRIVQPMPIRATGMRLSATGSAASAFAQPQPQQHQPSHRLPFPVAHQPQQQQLVPRSVGGPTLVDPSPLLPPPSKPPLLVHLHHQQRLAPLLELLALRHTVLATLTSGSDLHRQDQGSASVRFFVAHEQDLSMEQDRRRYAQRSEQCRLRAHVASSSFDLKRIVRESEG